jgi:hypothetical protein
LAVGRTRNVVEDGTAAVTALGGQQYSWLESQLQATLNLIPAHTQCAFPCSALVNERCVDDLGLPKKSSTAAKPGLPDLPLGRRCSPKQKRVVQNFAKWRSFTILEIAK